MPLEDWLLPNETIRFSAIDGHSKLKVNVTDKRLIFYKEGSASESLEAYMLDHIAGYRITVTRKISYLITGIINLQTYSFHSLKTATRTHNSFDPSYSFSHSCNRYNTHTLWNSPIRRPRTRNNR